MWWSWVLTKQNNFTLICHINHTLHFCLWCPTRKPFTRDLYGVKQKSRCKPLLLSLKEISKYHKKSRTALPQGLTQSNPLLKGSVIHHAQLSVSLRSSYSYSQCTFLFTAPYISIVAKTLNWPYPGVSSENSLVWRIT